MFLATLATLERNDLLKPDSEIKNIGAVMGMFIRFINDIQAYGIEFEDQDTYIMAYATKHNITVHGLTEPKYKVSSEGVELPEATAKGNDPWGWKKAYAQLKEEKKTLGGDSSDITSWTSAERKKASFDKKDPIPASAMAHIKKGEIMEMQVA
jgi:hypothetical protein